MIDFRGLVQEYQESRGQSDMSGETDLRNHESTETMQVALVRGWRHLLGNGMLS